MLKFIALSGTTGVTENLYIYEYGGDMLVVDCGVGFPEPEMLGIDLVVPDFSYIKDNKEKLRAILVSHGHEDHLGALPFLLSEVKVPVYSTKLVSGFIQEKLNDYQIKGVTLKIFDPEKDALSFGNFTVTPFRVSHSVPDGVGFAIDTPEGRVFHVADYKFDWTPVDGRPFDINKAAMLAANGCLALASDCLGATTPGYTESENEIEGRIEDIVASASRQVFITTISSNISRIQQSLNVAQRLGRKVSFIGRSIVSKAEIAKNLGYLHYPENLVVEAKQAKKLPPDDILYIISGSYGQPSSALYRLALGEHEFLKLAKEDTVIFSSDPAPPGSKANVDLVVDKLIEADIDVHYYDMQEDLHVSGHGSMEDIKMLFALLSPKYFLPIGGTVRHMRAYAQIAEEMGNDLASVFELKPGESVEFKEGQAKKGNKIEVEEVLVDGLGIGDVGNIVLRDRHVLAKEGIAITLIQIDKSRRELIGNPEIISRGFVFEAKTQNFLKEAGSKLRHKLESRNQIDSQIARTTAVDFLEKYFYSETGRRPMILPIVVEI